ncbi:MAG: PD40 domain-containing protein [Gemmatimonadota bacterium]|nr:MAG: PD40 domain-containing protein [Gemmatimonadota bacterium]
MRIRVSFTLVAASLAVAMLSCGDDGMGVDWLPWPEGPKIAFVSDRDDNYEIYVMDAGGSNRVRLTNDRAWDADPAWSPDGKQIAFQSDRHGRWDIYVMAADGSNQMRLTSDPAWDGDPAWSPDGMMISFASDRDGNAEIYVMGADGSNPVNLTNDPAGDLDPTWSPDGTKIAFVSNCDPWWGCDIYVMGADGSKRVNLTNDPYSYFEPAWSPDPGLPIGWLSAARFWRWARTRLGSRVKRGSEGREMGFLGQREEGEGGARLHNMHYAPYSPGSKPWPTLPISFHSALTSLPRLM